MPKLPTPLTITQTRWGTRFWLFQLIFLPYIINIGMYALFPTYTTAHVNFVYFLVSNAGAVWIFRDLLKDHLRLLREEWLTTSLWTLGGFAVYQLLSITASWITAILVPDFFNVNDAGITQSFRSSFWLMAVGTVLLAPVTEELFYRGLLFGLLHRRSRLLAYTVSVLFFCSIHVSGYVGAYDMELLAICFLQYIPAGLVLATVYEGSGSIYAPIAIHMAVNAMGMLSMR